MSKTGRALPFTPKYFGINSGIRDSGNSSNFLATIPRDRTDGNNRVSVQKISIPKTYYQTNTNNNIFQLQEGEIVVTISIDVGNYTSKNFISTITSLLNINSPNGWTYSVSTPSNPQTGKLTFAVSGNGGIQPSLIFPATGSAFEQMGFFSDTTNNFVGDSLVSTKIINLNKESTIYLRSSMMVDGDKFLCAVYGSSDPYLSYIVWDNPDPINTSLPFHNNASGIKFWLTDEFGTDIDLNGENFVAILLFFDA